ncbi:MAG: translocase FtsK protein [Candidatus Moranbacteria bacterium GW2011_GWE1_49_15]|nr:MAG: translocase FtsK protein [Candidatus Moranbacteria bacterium GW2011_GWE2_47_10]KKW06806.1 MAG: translocase FtsK protein [Candidatus Moranbacteria bacterium GW2011_GWE1_49_15]HBP00975.1 cell division protein FtsK [Candidatus Moranbacteria bacterium]
MGRRKKEEIEKEKEEKKAVLHGDVKRGTFAVFLFALAILFVLGFFEQAGPLGDFLDKIAGSLFGWGKWLSPFILIAAGIVLLFRKETLFYVSKMAGLAVIFLSMLTFFHIYFDNKELLEFAKDGIGGGYIGYGLAVLLIKSTGRIGGSVILSALLLSGIIIAFNFSLVTFVRKFVRKKMEAMESSRDNMEEEEIDEDPDPVVEHVAEPIGQEEDEPRFVENPNEEDEETEVRMPIMEKIFKKKKKVIDEDWELPPLGLLEASTEKALGGDVNKNAKIIQDTFKHFGIDVEQGEIKTGPTVTQYSFKPAVGVKLTRITALSNDLALALAAHPIRIEAPIPGKSLIGIEVPNKSIAMVRMRELLETPEFENRTSNLLLALGKDVSGSFIYADLKKMPHLMIAGSTNSGKSVCVNTILLSMIYQNSPEDLKLILVDPKRVELSLYNGIPHLLSDVIVENGKVLSALKWAIGEMERRYKKLQLSGSRDIVSYNKKAEAGEIVTSVDPETNETIEEEIEKIPYIVIVIDELADLMSTHGKEVEGAIIRLAQMARAVGIHLIVSTQKPVVTVITGLIKSNIPTRIAFKVPSLTDSRTMLDSGGAEKLLGNGDMLFLSVSATGMKRIQGVFVSEEEVKKVVSFVKTQKMERGEEEIGENIVAGAPGEQQELDLPTEDKLDFGSMKFEDSSDDDPLFEEAKNTVIQTGKASTSFLQRKFRIGYARAARLIDILEEKGIIGPGDGAKAREILVGAKSGPRYDNDMEDQTERDKWQM